MEDPRMRQCLAFEFETPKGYTMRALWFGPKKPKRVVIFLHGLGGSAFSVSGVLDRIVGRDTAVLSFNNRGFEMVTVLRRKDSERERGGAAHETFTECIDDIEGAIAFVRRAGIRDIYLAGHSTGCQKSVYWGHKRGKGVKGIILLAPISDHEAELFRQGKRKFERMLKKAQALVAGGKPHELVPKDVWYEVLDAQRLVSLYAPNTAENTFPYGRPQQRPVALRSLKIPVLVLWAAKDEYADRPAREVAHWFDTNIKSPHKVVVIPEVGHGFKGGEAQAAREVKWFIGRK